jgi:hypothetical protein
MEKKHLVLASTVLSGRLYVKPLTPVKYVEGHFIRKKIPVLIIVQW